MKYKITNKYYVPQLLASNGIWENIIPDRDLTRKGAMEHLNCWSCGGFQTRIIERIEAFKVVAKKDFTDQ